MFPKTQISVGLVVCSEDLWGHGTFNHVARVARRREACTPCPSRSAGTDLPSLSDRVQEGDFALISAARLGASGWRDTVGLRTWGTY